MKRYLIFLLWFPTTIITLIASLSFFSYRYQTVFTKASLTQKRILNSVNIDNNSYKMYVSLPKVLGISSATFKAEDAVPEMVRQYLEKYDSPMLETSNALVSAARQHNINPMLMVAIAQCESNLGKRMPPDCYNPFGWGIHRGGTLCFESWEQGYEKVAAGLKKNYGHLLDSPEKMMEKYNYISIEQAGGSWARCVSHFLEKLR